jgi:hypothetical protein
MIPALKKAITLVLLCTALSVAFNADARAKYYRYSGNLPFVEMMLEMMAAMGIIQRVPGNGLYGGYNGGRYGAWSSLLSQRGWPYSGYSPYSSYAGFPYSGYGGVPGSGYGSGVPLTINPLSGFPGGLSRYSSWNNPYESAYGRYDTLPFDRNLYRALNYDRRGYYDDGCYDGVCDGPYSRHRNLDGLWVANNGELLGLRDGRFLWSDGNTSYTTGIIERTPFLIRAYIDDSDKKVVYRYKLIGNEMLTIDASGTLRIFKRIPVNQASAYLNRQSGAVAEGDAVQADPADISGIDSGIYDDPLFNPLDYGGVNGQIDNSDWFLSSKYPAD